MTAEPGTTRDGSRVDDLEPPRAERSAEEIVERVSAQVFLFMRRGAARAREEVEDIVGEAQTLRRGTRPPE
jgi:hypothetical protein